MPNKKLWWPRMVCLQQISGLELFVCKLKLTLCARVNFCIDPPTTRNYLTAWSLKWRSEKDVAVGRFALLGACLLIENSQHRPVATTLRLSEAKRIVCTLQWRVYHGRSNDRLKAIGKQCVSLA